MFKSAFIRRGTEIVAALVIVISTMVFATINLEKTTITKPGTPIPIAQTETENVTTEEENTISNLEGVTHFSSQGLLGAAEAAASETSSQADITDNVISESAEAAEPVKEPIYKYIQVNELNVRKGPSTETEKLGSLTTNDRVQFLEQQGDWYQIITADNINGFILAQYAGDALVPIYKYISADGLNIRKGPSAETEKLGTLSKNNRVQLITQQGEWSEIITTNNIRGFVLAKYVVNSLPPVYKYINATQLNVRKGPSAETEKLATLSSGARVQVLEKQGEWQKLITKDGIEGYALAKHIVDTEKQVSRGSTTAAAAGPYNADLAASIIEYAKTFQGVKYVYGGSTPKGFDCSGFTQYVFKHFNISVPRSSYEYYNTGTKVSRSDLKPGDILLYDVYNNMQLGHVGIYIGNNQFIHASTSKGKVVIASITKYSGNLLGIRRVIK